MLLLPLLSLLFSVLGELCPVFFLFFFRKNPQHRMEYRHSALPARVAVDEDDDDVGQPSDSDKDEEDYAPTDEDSDWQPGKDDEEKEDVDELLKEAKRFMRRKT